MQKLSAWKANSLSMAGWLTFCKLVLAAMPTYQLQTARLPNSVCDAIDQISYNFLWGSTNEKSKIHLISWDIVCCPQDMGGLGIRQSRLVN